MTASAAPALAGSRHQLTPTALQRVCRDLAFSEIAAMPGLSSRLGPRLSATEAGPTLDWSPGALALDSLARVRLATAAAVWCNAYDVGFEDLFLAKRNVLDWAAVMQRARQAGAAHFTFSSSGSTGVRKHIRHQEQHLLGEAQAWATLLGRSPTAIQRVVLLAPTHHIYGFIWGVLLPAVLGVPALDADISALPALCTGDLVVAVPDQWAWLADASAHRWPAGVVGISSTAPLAAKTHVTLTTPTAHGPIRLARLLQIYGSSETAGLAWRDAPDAAYTLAPGRTRAADDNIALSLPGGTQMPLAVQDSLHWTSATQFQLLGRTDHSVQVGGHNVSPAWVEQQLRLHPAVQDASVRLDTSAQPPRLKAFVVLTDDASASRADQCQQFEAWVLDTLPWYAAFSNVHYGNELPRNGLGKLTDWPTQAA